MAMGTSLNNRAFRFSLRLGAFDAASAYAALAGRAPRAFLIERGGWSGEPESACLGVDPRAVIRLVRGKVQVEGGVTWREGGASPFSALGRCLRRQWPPGVRGPAWAGGAVGYLAYEAARHLERLPERRDLAEEALFYVFDEVLIHDYRAGSTEFVAWPGPGRSATETRIKAARRAEELERRLRYLPPPPLLAPAGTIPLPACRGAIAPRPRGGRVAWGAHFLPPARASRFLAGVRRIREHIRAGDVFQCVLSEQFRAPARCSALSVYQALRALNPSPYHFLIEDRGRALVGSSPERLLRVEGRRVLHNPIAGTRPRGRDAAEDRRLEADLRRSPKERAEHLMLVDLGRNDLGRVCVPGSVRVARYMDVRRFSRVMHLVSELEGRLESGVSPWDALAAAFPAGTVTGAPKVRAMEILAQLEPRARGFYAGAVVQLDPLGNLDSCIALRSISLERGEAVLQAGAGVVADSRPEREYAEVLHKLEACRQALSLATSRGGQS